MTIKNPYLFVSIETGEMIDTSKVRIYQTLPRQLPEGVSEEKLQGDAGDVKQGTEAMVYVQLVL